MVRYTFTNYNYSVAYFHLTYTEPLYLHGEGEYNLNVVKEVTVTESYLGLDKSVTECQMVEDFQECGTQHYITTLMRKCNCLPFAVAVEVPPSARPRTN